MRVRSARWSAPAALHFGMIDHSPCLDIVERAPVGGRFRRLNILEDRSLAARSRQVVFQQ